MKYYRIETGHGPSWAREQGDELELLTGDPWTGTSDTGRTIPAAGARLLAPVQPTKIVAVGLNYKDHAAERNKPIPKEPLLFFKPPSAVVGPEEPIRRPGWAGRVDHEAELGVVIGKAAWNVASPEAGLAHVLGAVCVNDVTARELQDKDVQFTRAKGFDSFCPVGPCLATGLDLRNLEIRGSVNGQVRQKSNTRELIFDVGYLVWYVARVMTLLPGDMITTGTPSGIGPLEAGDVVEVALEGVGVLRNPVL
jgi:2-keto-4-pentenoate hydratase/2-oxohepta-3-ene-1,7-dioic acid hydratase in catechol pathway